MQEGHTTHRSAALRRYLGQFFLNKSTVWNLWLAYLYYISITYYLLVISHPGLTSPFDICPAFRFISLLKVTVWAILLYYTACMVNCKLLLLPKSLKYWWLLCGSVF